MAKSINMLEAKTKVHTFWNDLRVSKGMTIREVAKVLGTSVSTTNYYLIGNIQMQPDIFNTLCELFDVDPKVAAKENRKLYESEECKERVRKMYEAASKKRVTKPNLRSERYWPGIFKKSGKTYDEIANLCDVRYKTLEKYIYGLLPMPIDVTKRLCDIFNLDFEEAMAENEKLYKCEDRKKMHTKHRIITPNSKNDTYWTRLRLKFGFTLKDLADYCGCCLSDMSKYCAGKKSMPGPVTQQLVDLFGVTMEEANLQNLSLMGKLDVPKIEKKEDNMKKNVFDNEEVSKEEKEAVDVIFGRNDAGKAYYDDSMPDIDYSKPLDAPENSEYRDWKDRHKDDIPESARRSKKENVVNLVQEAIYGKVDYSDFKRITNIIKYYFN